MRTSKSTLCLVICFLYLCCFVQQCQLLALITATNMMGNAVTSALTMTSAMGWSMMNSLLQGLVSTVGHGFSTIHTMTMSLISGFFMGNLALAGFILFLLAVVPAEEERRSLGGSSVFAPFIPYHNLSDHRGIPLLLPTPSSNSSLVRHKRSLLVNNATSISTGEKFTLPESLVQELNNTERVPRFLTRLVQRDPLNCLPLLLCGLSASRKPSERTEVLNDYAYLLKEVLQPDSPEDSAEYDGGSEEDDRRKGNKNDRLRSPLKLINQLFQGGLQDKQQDEVDKIINEMRREEDEKIEEEALTDLADDPNDLRFALEDMKVKGLTKTMSKMPKGTKNKYLTKLLGEDSLEEEDMIPDDEEDPYVHKALLGRFDQPNHPYNDESLSMEDHLPRPYPPYYNTRDLTRGAFPPPPPTPPVPDYGLSDDALYKRNMAMLETSLEHEVPGGFMRRNAPPPMGGGGRPGPFSRPPHNEKKGRRRTGRDVRHAATQRAFLQKKRGEAALADNIYEKARVATEVGAVTRNNRQCRALFNECPVQTIARPVAQAAADTVGGAPFLNRAVNNIRRVILGTSPGTSKAKRVSEIKEAIQQLQPQSAHHGGSEVKVVLNIGPSPSPQFVNVHRSGGPAGNSAYTYQVPSSPAPPSPQQSSKFPPAPSPTGFSTNIKYVSTKATQRPASGPQKSTVKPIPRSTQKTMVYSTKKPPSSTSPPADLDDLELLLKTTMLPMGSEEEMATEFPVVEEEITVPINPFTGLTASAEQDDISSEDGLVLPTKYPMSKDQYANRVRETFKIFDKFKKAHKTPVTVKIPRTTPTPNTRKTQKKSPVNKNKGNGGNKKAQPSKWKPGGAKGEQADLVLDDRDDDDDDDDDDDGGGQNDLASILKWFKKFRRKPKGKGHHKKKGKKGKGKKPNDSSEESSEEEDYSHPALVAVPPPHLRQKIHWRAGTTLVKDGVYHLLFGKNKVKPLPPLPGHYHDGSEEHHEKKPIRHDVHYYDHPHHDLPQNDDDNDEPHHDVPDKDRPHKETQRPPYYHRLRTSESVEDDIPPPPPILHDQEGEDRRPGSSSASESSSSHGAKIATRRPTKSKKKKKESRPITRPDPEPSSYEDDNYDDGPPGPRPLPPPLPPRRMHSFDSRSMENSYEDEDDVSEAQPEPPQLVFSQFSIVRNGNGKLKLKSSGKSSVTPMPVARKANKVVTVSSQKKNKGESKVNSGDGGVKIITISKSSSSASGGASGKNMTRRLNPVGNVNSGSPKAPATVRSGLMTKVKATSTTTVKPKRKILKYKHG